MVVAWIYRWQGWGIPLGMALLTTAVWYPGDAFYNDYAVYREMLGEEALEKAWSQVCLFLGALLCLVPLFHQWINGGLEGRPSCVLQTIHTDGLQQPHVQRQLTLVFDGIAIVWLVLMLGALWQVKGDVLGLFAPYLGHKVNPWARGRLGGGLDALWALAGYFHIFLTACTGVVAAIARAPRTRRLAILILCLSLPYFLLDRTRNSMLSTALPGLLAWVFLRWRGGWWSKGTILVVAFVAVEFWMGFILTSRSQSGVIQAVVSGAVFEEEDSDENKHLGLNMFEELGYITRFIDEGYYTVKPGRRYFAEAVNPIPRALWPGKPLIGIDYALARGQAKVEGSGLVTATISTGMIGQGVMNFGTFLGPLAAAMLMSLWVVLLARQDLMAHHDSGRLLLFGLGLILTFNMGRDITLLVLYPFFFGLGVLWLIHYWNGQSPESVVNPDTAAKG